MSKNVVIGIHGAEQALNGTEAIRTPRIPSGTERWVPEDTTRTGTISINKNGTYKAEDDNLYGYSRVIVNVPADTITGKGEDGNDYTVSRDPTTGGIVETKVPSSIRIVTPPDYTGPYGEGAYISFEGLTVEALYADGTSWGMVPFNELVFPQTVAHFDPEKVYEGACTVDGIDVTPVQQPFSVYHAVTFKKDPFKGDHWQADYSGPVMCVCKDNQGRLCAIMAADADGTYTERYRRWLTTDGGPVGDRTQAWEINNTAVYNGKTVYYSALVYFNERYTTEQNVISDQNLGIQDKIAWAMVYGDIEQTGGNAVPVQWPRTGDGLTLETQFYIDVADIAPSED